jgi:hypothetical protein
MGDAEVIRMECTMNTATMAFIEHLRKIALEVANLLPEIS